MMTDTKTHTQKRYNEFVQWLKSCWGESLLKQEAKFLVPIWEMVPGDYLLILGHPLLKFLTQATLIKNSIFLFPGDCGDKNNLLLKAEYEALPISPGNIHAILSAHVLEFSEDPRQVLREMEMALAPEGYLILMGFNPLSFFGIRHFFSLRKKMPWRGKFHTWWRIKDWLQLLNFEIIEHRNIFCLPSVKNRQFHAFLKGLENVARICLPIFGDAFIILAKKKRFGGVLQQSRWRSLSEVVPHGLVKPATRGLSREQNS